MIPPAQGWSREGLGFLRHRTLSVVFKMVSNCPWIQQAPQSHGRAAPEPLAAVPLVQGHWHVNSGWAVQGQAGRIRELGNIQL